MEEYNDQRDNDPEASCWRLIAMASDAELILIPMPSGYTRLAFIQTGPSPLIRWRIDEEDPRRYLPRDLPVRTFLESLAENCHPDYRKLIWGIAQHYRERHWLSDQQVYAIKRSARQVRMEVPSTLTEGDDSWQEAGEYICDLVCTAQYRATYHGEHTDRRGNGGDLLWEYKPSRIKQVVIPHARPSKSPIPKARLHQ